MPGASIVQYIASYIIYQFSTLLLILALHVA